MTITKRILLAYPNWDNRWIPYFKEELAVYETEHIASDNFTLNTLWDESRKADLLISMWASEIPQFWAQYFPDKKIIVYLRRYEFYKSKFTAGIRWSNVSALIFVNQYFMEQAKHKWVERPQRFYYIPNAVDMDQFKLKDNVSKVYPGRIAFVATGVGHKNFALAAQILLALGEPYTIHHIGRIPQDDIRLWNDYFKALGIKDRWQWYPDIPASQMPEWFKDKDFILSTSINEGNPNNVLEGMAVGLKPIIHAWPGAGTQFPQDAIFTTAEQAAQMIREDDYQPLHYRKWVEDHYSLDNIRQIHKVIEDVCG